MTDRASVEKLLDRIEGLPVLPVVAVKLLEITEDELTSAKDVANLIESDPALTAKIVKGIFKLRVTGLGNPQRFGNFR